MSQVLEFWAFEKEGVVQFHMGHHRGHRGGCSGMILFRWKLIGTCCVRRRKILHWWCRSISFMASFIFTVFMCWYIALPVDPVAHPVLLAVLFQCLFGCLKSGWLVWLWSVGSTFCQSVCFVISVDVCVSWDPLQDNSDSVNFYESV